MATANETLRDLTLSRQIGLQRLANGEVRKALAIFERMERRLNRELRARLRSISLSGADPGPITTLRLDALLANLRLIMIEGYQQIGAVIPVDLIRLAELEAADVNRRIRRALPNEIPLELTLPAEATLAATVRTPIFDGGGPLGEYFRRDGKNSLIAKRLTRYRKTLQEFTREGILAGETVETIVRRLSREVSGLSRRDLRTVVDSAVKAVSQSARLATLQANAGADGPVKGILHISTLDLRTTLAFCIPRDHKTWTLPDFVPVGHGYGWAPGAGRYHPRCRSQNAAVLKAAAELVEDSGALSDATRASATGEVPATTTAEQWLKQQSAAEQDRVFGHTKGVEFRKGELTVDQMVNTAGNDVLTLDELGLEQAA